MLYMSAYFRGYCFTKMAVDLAPSEEEGMQVIHEAIENYMKERS